MRETSATTWFMIVALVMVPCCWSEKSTRLLTGMQSVDLLFISHFDRDHVSGLKELARRNLLNSSTKVVMPFHYPSYFVILNPFLYAYYEQCMLILRSTGATIVEVEELNPFEDESWSLS